MSEWKCENSMNIQLEYLQLDDILKLSLAKPI